MGEKVDKTRLTQVGRALQELGIKMIAAYSPQARGRSERNFGTWQGRLPQELRIRGITNRDQANEFLRQQYVAEFNRSFSVATAQKGTAFVRCRRRDLDLIFSVQQERTVNQDNTVQADNRVFQIEKTRWRNTLTGTTVVVHEHLDGRVSIRYGPHLIAEDGVLSITGPGPPAKGPASASGRTSSLMISLRHGRKPTLEFLSGGRRHRQRSNLDLIAERS